MKDILIFKMWRHKLPAFSALATMAVAFLWPALFLGGITNWLRFFYYYSPQNYLLAAVTLLSGLYVGLFVYDKKIAACCSIDSKVGGAAGSVFGIFLGACPACIPFLAVFLPLSATITLSYYSWIFSMKLLERKLRRELKPGARVISFKFPFPSWPCAYQKNEFYLYTKK